MEMILRIFMIVLGIVLLGKTFASLAKRILTEHFGMLWGFFSVVLILAGILLSPTEWGSYISLRGLILVMITIFCVIEAGLVHQHPGIAVNTEESGTRHAGIAVESGE